MTTMLEKAAWALSRLSSHGEMPGGVEIEIEDTYDFAVQARAVLQAIREPDEAMVEDGAMAIWDMEPCGPFDSDKWKAADAYTAMIDAILNEKP